MPVETGQTLGSYEILAPLGAGGMGEVYRARDAGLAREVAIKVLPEAVAGDPERVLRFEREARVLASLEHANIGGIHGFESAEIGGRTIRYLVLEYVEGESLKQRLDRGALPIEESLEVVKQIAAALEAAHEKGIVHRDLKPANVQLKAARELTESGSVKVLDFGLARALQEDSGSSAVQDSPTITADFTAPGVVLGTAPYMSPEQARGRTVDKRADIWAFGCVLYECLTGTQAFRGDTVTDLFADIIKGEPDWERLPKDTPWKVRELLERCLTKDPSLRLRDIGDARIELGRLSTHSGRLTAAGETLAPQRQRPGRRAGIAAALLAAGGGLGWVLHGILQQAPERPSRHLAVDLGPEVPDRFLAEPTLTPDGSRLLFLAGGDSGFAQARWYVHDLVSGQTRVLEDIDPGNRYVWLSHDGSRVLFAQDEKLWHLALQGGGVLETPGGMPGIHAGAAAAGDGTLYFIVGEPHELYELAPGDPAARELYRGSETVSPSFPVPLPRGRRLLLTLADVFGAHPSIAMLDLESGELTRLIDGATTPTWLPRGYLLYVQASTMMVTRFDPETGTLGRDRHPVPGPRIELGAYARAQYTVSPADGSLIYRPGEQIDLAETFGTSARVSWADQPGPILEGIPQILDLDISPDGRWLVFSCFDPAGTGIGGAPRTRILRYDLQNPERPHSLLAEGTVQIGLRFGPDADRPALVYADLVGTGHEMFLIESWGEPRPLLEREGVQIPVSWTPEGDLLFQEGPALNPPFDLLRMDVGARDPEIGEPGVGEPEVLLAGEASFSQAVVSPDGRWLAFLSNRDGQVTGAQDLYVDRYPPVGPAVRLTSTGAANPQWDPRADRLVLYYRGGNVTGGSGGPQPHPLQAITLGLPADGSGERAGAEDLIYDDPTEVVPRGNPMRMIDVAPDGRILVVEGAEIDSAYPQSPAAADHFVYVTNFLERVERIAGDR